MEKDISDKLLKKQDEMPLYSALTVQMFTLFTLSVSCYSVIAPFMPLEIVKKGVDENVMGWIIGVFSLALIIVSPFMSYVIDRIGRRNPIIYGSLMLGISFWMFTLVHQIESKFWFTTLLFVFRIIQGVATVLIQVTCLSIVSTFYTSNRQLMLGLLSAMDGTGMMLGPLIGTGLFAIGGYNFMLISFGAVFIILGILSPFLLPKMLDKFTRMDTQTYGQSQEVEENEEEKVQEPSVLSLFKIPGYSFAALTGLFGYFQCDFLNPILGLRLVSLGLEERQVGLFFCILSFAFIIGSLIGSKLPKIIEKRVWIIIGVFASIPSQLLNGPSQILGFPNDSLWLIGIGQAMIGIFDPFILVNVLPEMIEVVEIKYPELNNKQKAQMADLTSGLLTSILGVGQITGPVFSAAFNKYYGYRLTCDIVALFALITGVLYFIFGGFIQFFRSSKI